MQSLIKYKNTEFGVRPNALGVGAVIAKLAAAYEDDLLISRYHVMRLPEYDRYLLVMNNYSQISADLEVQEAKLKKAKTAADKKTLKAIIDKDKKAIAAELKQLQEPAIFAISMRMKNIANEVMFGFKNNTDNLKALCDALLIGDTSVINYDEPDADLVKLQGEVFEVFFSIKSGIYK
jgi:hypothetical protein